MSSIIPIRESKKIKTVWKQNTEDDSRKIFEPIKLHNEKIGDIFVKINHRQGHNNFQIDVENKLGKNLGYEVISIDNDKCKKIEGFNIKVEDEYQRKNFRLGELLRLASIMEMMENNSSHIKIYSKNTAIYFHAKYKFEPLMNDINERKHALDSISKDKSQKFLDLVEKAKTISKKLSRQETKDLVNEYIARALKNEKPEKFHKFEKGMTMILTREQVLKNKEFFNKLYERHGINYKIGEYA